MMTKFKDYQIDFFNKAQERFGRSIISKTEALELASEMGRKTATWFVNPKFRVARNQFQIPAFDGPQMVAQVVPINPEVSLEQPMIKNKMTNINFCHGTQLDSMMLQEQISSIDYTLGSAKFYTCCRAGKVRRAAILLSEADGLPFLRRASEDTFRLSADDQR